MDENQTEEQQSPALPSDPINDGSKAQCEDWGLNDPIADQEDLQQAAMDMAKHYLGVDKYARRTEVIDARRQRFYRRGDQYINWNPTLFNFVPYPDTGAGSNGGADTPRYTDVYNIYWPYLRSLIAVGVQNPPGVDFQPDDPTKPTDVSAARAAETFRHFVDRVNKRKKIQSDVLSMFGTDGRTIIYTRSVRDAQQFGTDEKGQPNSAEIMTVHGVLESKVPIVSNSIQEWPYCFLSDEPDLNIAKQTYPKYASNIKQRTSSVGESAYERMARIGVLQGTRLLNQAGDAYAHLTTRHRAWFRPAAFRHLPDSVRQKITELYPDGMKLVTCGGAYCGSFNQSMDDHISVGWPGPGDGMSKPSMLKDLVAVQDAYNDYRNLEKEIFDFCIPTTYRDSETGDIEALREQTSEPGNNVSVTKPAGLQSLADAFYTEPPPASPPSMVAAYQDLMGAFAQFQTGAQPALFGGSDEHNETKGGIAMLRDAAMGQFSICWGGMQELFASAYKQSVLCRAQSEEEGTDKKISFQMEGGNGNKITASVAIADLQKGNFHAYPDMDSSFPETTGSKRQTMMSVVTQAMTNPVAADAFGVLEPANLEAIRQINGMEDWVIPGADAYDKQMQEIEILLKQKPVPDIQGIKEYAADSAIEAEVAQKAEGTGLPVPPPEAPDPNQLYKPSVPIGQLDFHTFEAKAGKDWASSPAGIQAAKTNVWGFLNVTLHIKAHIAAIPTEVLAQPALPMPAPQPGAQPIPTPTPGAMNAPTGIQ